MKREKEENAPLSEIIQVLNERFNTDFTQADRLFFEQIEEELMSDERFIYQAKNNRKENLKYSFDEMFDEKAIDRMEQNQDIFGKLFNDKDFGRLVRDWMLNKLYDSIIKYNPLLGIKWD